VRELDGLHWMHFGDGAIQAMLALQDPSRPIIPYQLNMLMALLFNPAPASLLNLGLGGGSFERFFTAYMPELSLTSVESDTAVIGLQQEYFPIPDPVPVIECDAATFLAGTNKVFDLVLCDIFARTGPPVCLSQEVFYANIYRHLSAQGVLVINLLPEGEPELLASLLVLRASFSQVVMLQLPGFRNILLFCLKRDPSGHDLLQQRAGDFYAKTGIDLLSAVGSIRLLPKPQR